MIYLKNIREKQTIHIPRTEINSKVVVIKSYDEGYADGIAEGKKLQKLKLTNLTVSENGVYKREDGWSEVKVDVEIPENIGNTQEKTLIVTKDIDIVVPDSGYDAMTKVSVNATQYGQNKRNEGYDKGFADGKAEGGAINLVELYETPKSGDGENNIVEYKPSNYNADGFSNVKINVTSVYHSGYMEGNTEGYNQGYSAGYEEGKSDVEDVELIEISDAPKMEQVNPSNNLVYTPSKYGADGFSKVSINVTNIYGEGYNAGKADVDEVELVELSVTPEWENRDDSNCVTYHPSIYSADGFSNVVVNISEVYNEGYRQGMANNPSTGSKIKLSAYGLNFTDKDFEDVISWFDFNGVVNMNKMFYSCEQLTNMPLIDTSSATSMEEMFAGCTNLTSVPQLVTSNVTDMSNMFAGTSLTTIPLLDTSKVTDMFGMFSHSSLTTIPQLDTSKVNRMANMFYSCVNLTSIPLIDTSNVTDMSDMFRDCYKLTTIPLLNTSKVTDMTCMFMSSGIKTIPLIDTSNVTTMYETFALSKITTIPQLDTSNVTDMSRMFYNCPNLTSISLIDTSKVKNMYHLFSRCEKLESVPALNTSRVTDMTHTFNECYSLKSIPSLSAYMLEDAYYAFGTYNLDKLTDFGGFKDLRTVCNMSVLPNLSTESCMNVLNGLFDFTGNRQTPTSDQGKLVVHQNFLTRVGDQISIATNKGWTITA